MDERFRGFRQLIGGDAYARVARASVCVVGIGGVGSWVVEALARSGVGAVTLVDLDEVCITNLNRQIHALGDTVGASKVDVMAERISRINPNCVVTPVQRFFTEQSAEEILSHSFDLVIDCIDRLSNKILLIATCHSRGIPIVTVGSGGNRLDPLRISVADLSKTWGDPLLSFVRKRLRQEYGFPRGERSKFGVPCVFLPQPEGVERPEICEGSPTQEEPCSTAGDPGGARRSCNDGLGTASFVTGALGFALAAEAIKILTTAKSTI